MSLPEAQPGRRSHGPVSLLLVLLTAIAACDTADSPRTDSTGSDATTAAEPSVSRDSAGVAIVETTFPDEPELLYALEAPALVIGGPAGEEEGQLHRVQDALRLEDGRVVVLNSGDHEVRVYTADGTLQTRFGRQGNGPAEFAGLPAQLALGSGDTLAVWDLGTWETSRFLLDGTFVDRLPGRTQFQARIPEGMTAEGGRLSPDRGLVLNAYEFGIDRPVGQVFRPAMRLMYVGFDGEVREMASVGGIEQVMVDVGGRPRATGIPFGSAGIVAYGGRPFTVWAGHNDTFELRQFGPDGRLRRIVRADRTGMPVGSEDVEQLLVRMRDAMADAGMTEEQAAQQLEMIRRAPAADVAPVFGAVFVTRNGGAWVARPDDPSALLDETAGPSAFDVFGPRGEWRGIATKPRNVRPLEIGLDYLLGLRTDDLGVQSVVLYELTEPAGD